MTTEDPKTNETASAAIRLACERQIAALHPELPATERAGRGEYLTKHRAVALDHPGSLVVPPEGVEHVQRAAPRLLDGEPTPRAAREARSIAREAELAARLAASR